MAKRTRLGQVVAPALLMSLGMAPLGAQALGATRWQVTARVTWPLLRPRLLEGALCPTG